MKLAPRASWATAALCGASADPAVAPVAVSEYGDRSMPSAQYSVMRRAKSSERSASYEAFRAGNRCSSGGSAPPRSHLKPKSYDFAMFVIGLKYAREGQVATSAWWKAA